MHELVLYFVLSSLCSVPFSPSCSPHPSLTRVIRRRRLADSAFPRRHGFGVNNHDNHDDTFTLFTNFLRLRPRWSYSSAHLLGLALDTAYPRLTTPTPSAPIATTEGTAEEHTD